MSSSEFPSSTLRIVQICVTANLGGLLIGIHLSLFSGILEMAQFAAVMAPDGVLSPLDKSTITTALLAGFVLMSPFVGSVVDRMGRRNALMVTAALFVSASWVTLLCRTRTQLVGARLLAGVAYAVASVASPMYTAEVAPPHLRGMLVNLFQLSITIGILYALVCNMVLDGGEWTGPVRYSLAPALVMCGLVWATVPESPTWLASQLDAASDDLETATLKRSGLAAAPGTAESENKLTVWGLLADRSSRYRLMIGGGLSLAQQVSGVNSVIFFGPAIVSDVLQRAGGKTSLEAAALIGLVNMIATVVSLDLVRRFGRRTLLLSGAPPMLVSLVMLGGMKTGMLENNAVTGITALVMYIAAFATTYGPLPFLVCSEIFPVRYKGLAMSLCSAILGASSMAVGFTFLPMLEAFGGGAYYFYALCMVIVTSFVWRMVPETKNLSLQEIDELLEKRLL